MQTDNDLEQRLRTVLRQALDREAGPDPAWDESPAARRITQPERRRPTRWTLRVLAVAALITIGVGSALLFGAPDDLSALGPNGWIAFGMHPEDGGDQDIWFVSLDQEPRRVIGTDTDSVDQLCPAFSPDGRSLAYGEVDQSGATPTIALVVAAVNSEGDVSEQYRVDVGEAPPCPMWSPGGDRIAFGVPLTSVGNPERGAEGSEVWIVTVADRGITVLPDLLATDLEFSPDGSLLGIASGQEYSGVYGNALADGHIYLYELVSGATRTLESTLGAVSFTWSPDGGRIAYLTGDYDHGLMLIDLGTEEQRELARPFTAVHGIGPAWSPDGGSIVFQRSNGSGEDHDVVLVWPDDLSADDTPREEIIPLIEQAPDGAERPLKGPYWVTWSPDGEYLVFTAWSSEIDPLLGVVPIASGTPATLLVTDQDVAVNPVYESGPFVPIQTWGRRPADAVMPTPTSEASVPEPTPSQSAWVGLPAGLHLLLEGIDSGVPVTVTIPEPLWNGEPNAGVLCWRDSADTCAGPPDGAGIFAFASREYHVYADACHQPGPGPDATATTADELVDALARQVHRAAFALEDVTVDGYVGKRIRLVAGPPPGDCDYESSRSGLALFGLTGDDAARYGLGTNQIEEVWAIDVDGAVIVLEGAFHAATPQNAVDELRAILGTAAFE